jgi:Tol biopolymer transport system component
MARRVFLLGVVLALAAGCGSSAQHAKSTQSTVARQQGPPVRAHGQFLVMAGGGIGATTGELYLVDAATGRTRFLSGDLDIVEIPRWSPDGRSVLSSASRHENNDLISYPAGGGHPENVTATNREWEFGGRWSPDGSRIAYLLQRKDSDHDLYVAGVDGGSRRLIGRHVDGFAWSPDSRRLAFAPGLGRKEGRLLVVPVRGGRAKPLGPGGNGEFIEWGPHGRLLYEAGSAGPTPTYLWTGREDVSLGYVDDAQFLPDGTVAFGAGRKVGFVRPGGERRMARLSGRPTSYSWSPDGRYLAYVSAWTGDVYVARADGSGIHRLPARLGRTDIEVFGWRPQA